MVRLTEELLERMMQKTIEQQAGQALQEITAWLYDVQRDNPELTADEVFSDVVHAYLDAEVGTRGRNAIMLRREILRRTGVGERSY
jgi:hypothetical protein